MSDKNAFLKSLTLSIIVAVLLIGIPLALHTFLGLPRFWTVVGVLIAVVYASATLPPYFVSRFAKQRSPSHERISATRTWQSPHAPPIVLAEIDAAFRGRGAVSRIDDKSLEIKLGSDEEFRKWGIFSVRGRRNLPSRTTVHVLPDGGGSHITADASDDLGWFVGPLGLRVKQEARKSVESLLDELDPLAGMERKS